ncbi:MAG: hypothetical protein LBE04_05730 [Prevotellaceae bacterium]|nr:hypothetical protein [Prevotellaceae bacterium]
MQAVDFCYFCNAPLSDNEKRFGECRCCGAIWTSVQCDVCGDWFDNELAEYDDETNRRECPDCRDWLPF